MSPRRTRGTQRTKQRTRGTEGISPRRTRRTRRERHKKRARVQALIAPIPAPDRPRLHCLLPTAYRRLPTAYRLLRNQSVSSGRCPIMPLHRSGSRECPITIFGACTTSHGNGATGIGESGPSSAGFPDLASSSLGSFIRPSAHWTSGSERRRAGLTTSRRGRSGPGLRWRSRMTCLSTSAATRPPPGRAWLPSWDQVPGFFDFAAVYDAAVAAGQDGDVFVEIGCLAGRSTCYLASRIKESGKAITLYAVDPSTGSPSDSTGQVDRAGRGRVDGRHSAPQYPWLRAGGLRRADPDDLGPGGQACSRTNRSLSASLTPITATRA